MNLTLVRRRPVMQEATAATGAVQSGDRVTWERLVKEHHGRVFNLLLRLTGDREAAADLTQETFVAAFRSAASYSGKGRPESWLYGVAMNCHRSWRRRSGLPDAPDDPLPDLADPAPSPEELAQLGERRELLADAVRRLPETYRRTVALRYWGGLAAAEIAVAEGIDAGTVRWRLHHAQQRLWTLLQPHLGKEEAL
jgi:RNA polymerase sigma factor (sigma-70 family)